jgi:hypothetical protein
MRTVCLVPGRVWTVLLGATELLISLKLFGEISWPWVWVLAPLWLELPVVILYFAVSSRIAAWIAAWRVARSGRRGMAPR